MTKLNGKVSRLVTIRLGNQNRQIAFTLDGDEQKLTWREKGSSKEYFFPLQAILVQSVQMGWRVQK